MDGNKKLEELNKISYITLGRFLGTVTMLQTYSEIHHGNIPKERLEIMLQQFINITKEYDTYSKQIEADARRKQEGNDTN